MGGIKTDEMDLFLTDRMRKFSKDDHNKSDKLVNLKLVFVLTSRKLYGESLALFAPVYEKIETLLESKAKSNEQLNELYHVCKDLRRYPGFKKDIEYYLGRSTNTTVEMDGDHSNQALTDYLDHLDGLVEEDPVILTTYVYHMYMAILAGGFIIRKMVQKAFSLPTNNGNFDGVNCFEFDINTSCREIRKNLKGCVNEKMKFTERQEKRILEESKILFQMNNCLVSTVNRSNTMKEVSNLFIKRFLQASIPLIVSIVVSKMYFSSSRESTKRTV